MGPLMYLCDGNMVYEYSFLVDLDIMSPLVQLVFGFGQLQERYGYLRHFAVVWLWEMKIKCIADDGEFS